MDTDSLVPALLAVLAVASMVYGLFVVQQPILYTLVAGLLAVVYVVWRLLRASA
ncbi:hypothetical protein [Halobacterium wangiae]|uniref:hypothetical protein n=1 Tax=Halobacterium wangiae TaxID=2902623 RepID=UPI001E2C3981|nr:hypothetical protein [Halobacterium wangiae]